MNSRWIISAPYVVTMASDPIIQGSVVVDGIAILDAGDQSEIRKRYPDLKTIVLENSIIMPALVNCHSHIALTDAASVNTGKSFPEWLFDLMEYRQPLTVDDIHNSCVNGLKEHYRNGITTIGDSNPDTIPLEAAVQNNFRGVFFFEVFGLSNPVQLSGIIKYKFGLARSRRISTNISLSGISPHTPYTVTPSVLKFASNYAEKNNLRVSMHVAENSGEIEFLKSRDGLYRSTFAPHEKRIPISNLAPLYYVDSFKLISEKFICAHGVHLSEREFALLAERGASLVTCPSSNHNVKAGHLDIRLPLKEGVNLCVGTDSPASGDGIDLLHELRLALKKGDTDEVRIDARTAIGMITVNPAKALGFDNIGMIKKGYDADLIALKIPENANTVNIDPHDLIVSHLDGNCVELTVSRGKVRHSRINNIPSENL